MSTLKTHNLQSPDAGSVNIAMAPNAGMVVAGLSTYSNQINVGSNIKLGSAGVVTATSFVGSGANLTSIPAGSLTGTVADARITTLTASKLSGALPAISGANLTNLPAQATIANNADNRVITGGSGVNLNGEAGLTYNGQALNVNSVTSENNAFRIYNTTDNSVRYQINGEGNSFIGHTYPRSDGNLDLGFHSGYRWRDLIVSGGVRFGASGGNHYLDDYEEGSWNPTYTTHAGNVGSVSYSHQAGWFVKIGHTVMVAIDITVSSASGMSGNTCIGGFPFQSNFRQGLGYYYAGTMNWYIQNHHSNQPVFTGWMMGNTSLLRILYGSHWNNLSNCPLNQTGRMSFSLWYTTNS